MSVIIRIWGIVALMRSECWDLTGYFMVKDWQDDKLQKIRTYVQNGLGKRWLLG